uniref:HTH-type transcriptional regulator n=1 Tax=Acetithermum autotrophicum TaxID=1446466 RepID=H5SQC7_ACEAU|nr:transcriptional regulator [Candidatus Acetothermum autotrophicum]
MKKLDPIVQRFILHWGEMGTRWGLSRTVAQIHALLYLSPKPLNAEEISEILDVSRSNVSTSLKELQGWGVVRVVHIPGDRRDYFETIPDVWEMFKIILSERKRRELDPTLALLRSSVEELERSSLDEGVKKKVLEIADFFETLDAAYHKLHKMPTGAIRRLVKLGDRVLRALGLSEE